MTAAPTPRRTPAPVNLRSSSVPARGQLGAAVPGSTNSFDPHKSQPYNKKNSKQWKRIQTLPRDHFLAIQFFVKACSTIRSRNGLGLVTSSEDEHVGASSGGKKTFLASPYGLCSRRGLGHRRGPCTPSPAPREQGAHGAIPTPSLRDPLPLKKLIFQTLFRVPTEQPACA